MNFFFTSDEMLASNTAAQNTTQQTEVAPAPGVPWGIAPATMFNYLNGAAIVLILLGMLGVVARSVERKRMSRKAAQIERLERIWRLNAQRK